MPLSWTEIKQFVGTGGIGQFIRVWEHLGYLRNPRPRGRFAPSVITRGETQLFSLDIPRFTIRINLGDTDKRSFLNLRRMTELKRGLRSANWLTQPQSQLNNQKGLSKLFGGKTAVYDSRVDPMVKFFNTKINIAHAISDGVIVPPRGMLERYYMVTADFGWVSGEGQSAEGVFFASALSDLISGGACAQSSIAMLNAHAFAQEDAIVAAEKNQIPTIHGLAGITSLTTPAARRHLKLGGLSERAVFQYFIKMKRATYFHLNYGASADDTAGAVENTVESARTYARSGIPSILFVNEEEGVAAAPRTRKRGKFNREMAFIRSSPTSSHCVVTVGAFRDSGDELPTLPDSVNPRCALFVNDPATYPLLPWTRDDLARRAILASEPNGAGVRHSRQLVVLPPHVQIPYRAGYRSLTPELKMYGISEISGALVRREPGTSQFALCRIVWDKDNSDLYIPPNIATFCGRNLFRPWTNLKKLKKLIGHWIWIERLSPSVVRFWNAEAAPPDSTERLSRARVKPLLIAHAQLVDEGGATQWAYASDPKSAWVKRKSVIRYAPRFGRLVPAGQQLPLAQRPGLLQAGLITSFSPTTLENSLRAWPKEVVAGDLYAFMHRDEKLLGPLWKIMNGKVNPNRPPAVMDVLAQAMESQERKKLAEDLAQKIVGMTAKFELQLKFRAMSTFLPSLFGMCDINADKAIKAICFCSILADQLSIRQGEKLRVIEIVAGSRIDGLIPLQVGHPRPKRAALALRLSRPAMLQRIEQRLRLLCAMLDLDGSPDVALALEVEPGPLYALNNGNSLRSVAKILTKPGIRGRVGFNVDIAHCTLSGIGTRKMFEKSIRNLIIHHHISDLGNGHYADCTLCDSGFNACVESDRRKEERFWGWVEAALDLAKRRQTRRRRLPFSGMISVELEAAKSRDDVIASCAILQQMFFDLG